MAAQAQNNSRSGRKPTTAGEERVRSSRLWKRSLADLITQWADNDLRAARKSVRYLLEAYPSHPEVLRTVGHVLEAQALTGTLPPKGREAYLRQAYECYQSVLRCVPGTPGALVDVGEHWDRRRRFRKAIQWFDAAIRMARRRRTKHREELEAAYWNKIEALKSLGDVKAAVRCREQALEDLPRSRRLRTQRV